MIGDYYRETFPQRYPWVQTTETNIIYYQVSREEFEALREDVQEMKALLIRAKIYDEANGEPNCEMEEKIEMIKRIADMVGIDLHEVFG